MEVLERRFAINFLEDQKAIWTSPLHLKKRDLYWLAPAAALTAEAIHRDQYAYQHLNPAVHTGELSKRFSDAGVIALAGTAAGMYVWGRVHENDHLRETGILATEALANSLTTGYVIKGVLQRERPFNGSGNGDFFVTGGGTSFPSSHALMAWSMASVIAHEYPGTLTKLGVYSLAAAVSATRVTGREHFPADVLVGSALGWGIGTMTYRRHHDTDLPGQDIGNFNSSDKQRASVGTVEVPLDSWVYPAMDRLYALGFVPSGFRAMKPWTRTECLRIVNEADDLVENQDDSNATTEGRSIVEALRREFDESVDNDGSDVTLESIYTRFTGISGEPLRDGYHFAQTDYNDYGRPFGEGGNMYSGGSAWAHSGRWSAHVRAEYQHAPDGPALPLAARIAISDPATGDATPLQPATPIAELNQARLLDAYVAVNIWDWQLSFGKQSLWWGPGQDGALNLSNNAAPMTMVRLSRVTPFTLPSLLAWMGPMKTEFFIGRLSGHQFVRTDTTLFTPPIQPQPLIDGLKLSFKPTPNLEFGFSTTTIFGGPGFPVTMKNFFRTFSISNAFPGAVNDPGDRRSGFDFSYRVPKLRNWLLIYNDSFIEDEFSPIAYPRRSAMRSGLYMPRLPKLPKADFRVEGVYTDIPNLRGAGVSYFNTRYLSGFTNDGNVMGDWIGREGQGLSVQTSYWLTPQNKIKVSYRTQTVNPDFLQGGHLQDFGGESSWTINKQLDVYGSLKYEHWNFPILGAPRSNVSTTIQLSWRLPKHR